MEEPKVGELVRLNLPHIIEYCEQVDPDEVIKLSDQEYCMETFGLIYPFFRSPAEASQTKVETNGDRYWVKVHRVLDRDVRVTNNWFEKSRGSFLFYLADKGIKPSGVSAEVVEAEIDELSTLAEPPTPSGARFKLHAIGNAQNSVVRNVLGRLGEESFTAKDWLAVKRRFGHRCAYCSSPRQLVMDHAVPIGRDELGEHRLGNLVPACGSCNSVKGGKRYDDYLREQRDRPDAAARITTIEDHMAEHDYRPLTDLVAPEDAAMIRDLLEQMRLQIANASTSTVAAINEILPR